MTRTGAIVLRTVDASGPAARRRSTNSWMSRWRISERRAPPSSGRTRSRSACWYPRTTDGLYGCPLRFVIFPFTRTGDPFARGFTKSSPRGWCQRSRPEGDSCVCAPGLRRGEGRERLPKLLPVAPGEDGCFPARAARRGSRAPLRARGSPRRHDGSRTRGSRVEPRPLYSKVRIPPTFTERGRPLGRSARPSGRPAGAPGGAPTGSEDWCQASLGLGWCFTSDLTLSGVGRRRQRGDGVEKLLRLPGEEARLREPGRGGDCAGVLGAARADDRAEHQVLPEEPRRLREDRLRKLAVPAQVREPQPVLGVQAEDPLERLVERREVVDLGRPDRGEDAQDVEARRLRDQRAVEAASALLDRGEVEGGRVRDALHLRLR